MPKNSTLLYSEKLYRIIVFALKTKECIKETIA